MAAPIPKKIGKYDVIDVVGRGVMGVVYRAKDPFLDRMVAIKIMTISYADYPDLLQRFYREAKATANLQHPNIVTVYELGEHEGSPYLAMQFLEGASLEALVRSGQELTLLQKLDVVIQACHGLAYAHQRGIVHRDIKPGNIMVLKDGNVKIVDFGIARIGDTNFTRTGQFMGSLNYMSLEQLNDKLTVDQRTDVYSTGVVLYQVLTGALPFEADSTGATLMKILNEAPPPFSKYLSSFPPELETITLKALAKDRDQRYSSADEFALDLTQLADRLKREKIDVHMQHAEQLLQENNLFQANDHLLEVLKLDKQNTKAATMLRTLRKQIEKEQSAERSRQLREQAEEALRREDFDPALGYLEQAIHLDTTNVDLQELKAKVQAAKAEIEHLRQVMHRAENAHRAGNLDTAKQAIEEVLARRPNDTRVKSLYRMIQKELDDRMRQKRMEGLLESARKEMANRQHTAALNLLKEAEQVDPESPALRSLLETFTAARDQEQRRRALEQSTRQIEQALNTDDPQTALNLLAEGLQKYPGEPALLKLKDLAETQKQAAQVKSFVRERIAAAREILNAGNATGALKVLQEALKKAPGNPHLESLVSIAQERLAQDRDEQAKSRCVQQANDAVGRRAYDEAIQILEAGQVQFAASPEIDNLLRFAREQQARDAKQQEVENAARRAQEFLRAQEYDRAIELLESVMSRTPDDELRIVLEEARRRRQDLDRQITAAVARGRQFLSEGSPAKAVEFLQAQPASFRKSAEFRELLQTAVQQNKQAAPVVSKPELDLAAPEPAKPMMWSTTAPPEVEPAEVQQRPAAPPSVPTKVSPPAPAKKPATKPAARPAAKAPAPSTVEPATPKKGLSKQTILFAAIGAAVLLVIVIAIAIWPHSATTPSKIEVASGTPTPTPTTGTLTVQSSEDSADVFVDDALKGSTSNKQLIIRIPTGSHVVRVEKQGFDTPASQKIDISSNTETQLHFPMVASKTTGTTPAPPKDSYFAITGPEGATVRVDGASQSSRLSDTAIYVKVSPNSTHHIEAMLNGYEPWSTDAAVKPGDRQLVKAVMKRLPTPKAAPVIAFFRGPSDAIPPGKAQISWSTSNATAVDIDGVGPNLAPNDSREVNVSQTTSFKLTAKGEGGNTEQVLTINVKAVAAPKAPAIPLFTSNTTRIKQGDSVTFSWTTTDASSTTINGIPVNPPANGTWTTAPGDTTTYTLLASGNGSPAKSSVTITVDKAPQPPQPPAGGGDLAGIRDALSRLEGAYADETIASMLQAWPSLDKKKQKELQDTFSGANSLKAKFQCDGDPVIAGTTASWKCVQTMTIARGGKRLNPIDTRVSIGFRKGNNGWVIDSVK
ncbi:MAG TPA: protein kinase [Candidatus Nitrosotalea sp.]|nr:protein kinase [Candidatus Nitrosotalea sp.]